MTPKFKRQIELAALSGITLAESARVYGRFGQDVPTTPEEADAALGLPPGTVAAFFGGA